MIPKQIKKLQAQSRRLETRRVDKHTFVVQSTSNHRASHVVTVDFGPGDRLRARCTCEWALNRGVGCRHVMAALEYMAAMKRRTLSFWSTEAEAKRQKQRVFYLDGGEQDSSYQGGVWITSRAG
jgi:hypothetical protein